MCKYKEVSGRHNLGIKLGRTDTTLDLSQRGKGSWFFQEEGERRGVYIAFWRVTEWGV
jgi:hypothetical protein